MRLSKSLGKFPHQDTQKYTGIKYLLQVEPDLVLNDVSCNESVWNVKNKIKSKTGIDWFCQTLQYGAQTLDSYFTLATYGILTDTTLTLIDSSPKSYSSKRKREPSPTEGKSKAHKSSASESVKSTGATKPQVYSSLEG